MIHLYKIRFYLDKKNVVENRQLLFTYQLQREGPMELGRGKSKKKSTINIFLTRFFLVLMIMPQIKSFQIVELFVIFWLVFDWLI